MLNSIQTEQRQPGTVAITLQGGKTVRIDHGDLETALQYSKPAVRLVMLAKYSMDSECGRELWRTITAFAERDAKYQNWICSQEQIRNAGFLSLLGTVWSVLCQDCDGKGSEELSGETCKNCSGKGTTDFNDEQASSLIGVRSDVYRVEWSSRVNRLRSIVSEWEQEGLAHAVLSTAKSQN